MSGRLRFRNATFGDKWPKSYLALDPLRRRPCDSAVIALLKTDPSPGLRIHPILPSKYFSEARINSGDRIVFRLDGDAIVFVDVVAHDHVDRYAQPGA